MSRVILHADMDAFFAAVEVLDDPTLAGKPVVVGGTPEGRGVVTSATYEARAFGVRSAMPAAQARRLCPQAVFLRGRMERYAEVSRAVFAIFHEEAPVVQGVSVDEAYLDCTGTERLLGGGEAVARRIRARVRGELGLTVSVGVAPNKFVAKIASERDKPDGLVVVRPGEVEDFLAGLPVRAIPGVGTVTGGKLERLGLKTIRDLRVAPLALLQAATGRGAEGLRRLAHGQDDRPVHTGGERRSVGCERTFSRDIGDAARLRAVLDELCDEAARRLRSKGLRARNLTLKARYPDFTTVTRARMLRAPTDVTRTFQEAARELLERRLDRRGRPLRLLGVSLRELEDAGPQQLRLFDAAPPIRDRSLDQALDAVRARFGPDALARGTRRLRRRDPEG